MRFERNIVFWIAALAILIGLLWLLSPILLPFVLGIAIALIHLPQIQATRTVKTANTTIATPTRTRSQVAARQVVTASGLDTGQYGTRSRLTWHGPGCRDRFPMRPSPRPRPW